MNPADGGLRPEVLLAGASERPGLATARSLSRRGIRFVALADEPRGMVARSRHVRRYLRAPRPDHDPDTFFDAVLGVCAEHDVRLVMPMDDAALAVCSERRDALPAGTSLAAASVDAVRNVLDKRLNLETANRLGIPCPAEFALEDLDQTADLIDRLGFPMVLKNPGRAAGAASLPHAFKWVIARDERELRTLLDQYGDRDRLPLFQELVEGQVRNLCCFAASGAVVAAHEYRSVRRVGWEGNSVLREVTASSPQLVRYAEQLLGELRWDGVAHVGFIVRERDGASWYMETNGRFWGSVEGSIAIGWDFPYWAYRYFTGGELPVPPPTAVGSRTCWHFGDLRLLGKRLRGIEPPVPPRPSPLRAIADYITGFGPGIHSDVFAWDDPLPELVEHWDGVCVALGRRLPGRLGTAAGGGESS
jgi:predicted ATP-grasp superfamily ATP-dependent carboligase